MPASIDYSVLAGPAAQSLPGHAPGFGRSPHAVLPVAPPLDPRHLRLLEALRRVSGNMAAPMGKFLGTVGQASRPPDPTLASVLAGPAAGVHATLDYVRRLQHALIGARDPQLRSPSEAMGGDQSGYSRARDD